MDDPDKMDLALNSDFDSSLLNCWEASGAVKNETKPGNGGHSGSPSPRSNHSAGGGGSWDGNSAPHFSRLPSFTMEDEANSSHKNVNNLQRTTNSGVAASGNYSRQVQNAQRSAAGNAQRKSPPVPVSTSVSVASTKDGATSTTPSTYRYRMLNDNNSKDGSKSHTATTSAGATQLPTNLPHQHSNNATSSMQTSTDTVMNNNATQLHPLAIQSSANCPPHVMQSSGMNHAAFFPMALSSLQGNAAAAAFAAGMSLQMTNLNNPNASASFFQSMNANNSSNNNSNGQQQQQQVTNINTGQQQQQQQHQSPPPPQQQHHQQQKQQRQQNVSNNTSASSSTTKSPPPFYLFDAPAELRANFMQSQRMHGLPVTEDNNSYHYGVAVNGFHPQYNAQLNPTGSVAANSGSISGSQSQAASTSVKLIDARHGNRKSGRIKNEREQRRAQKITELIEQLREKMETGGWKVEVKSKFHTLSSCADYVKHLIKTTKEKEDAVKKAKSDLQAKERKAEEDKALQESRSDPESVMSSLTSSTGESGHSRSAANAAKRVSSEHSSEEGGRKRKSSSSDNGESTSNKKSRKSSTSDSGSSESSGGEDQQCQRSSGHNTSLDKATSSVSDLTDSNKGSSKSDSDAQNSNNQRTDDDEASGAPSSLSASSSAAVVKGRDRNNSHTKHADVVIKGRNIERKHKLPAETTSLEESFVLDYEEVFLKSNVPQLIATTAGRIVAWNDFFLKATGISKSGAKGLTIFSLVKQEKLSNLFEIVAKALRKDTPPPQYKADMESSEGSKWDYTAMTLPCIEFKSGKDLKPLYITVTLMYDEDPQKRLFHCVFTDCPGTKGSLGSITPELLSLLFTRHNHRKNDSSDHAKPRRSP